MELTESTLCGFQVPGNAWEHIPLQELPSEFKEINLAFSSPDYAAKETIHGLLTAEQIKNGTVSTSIPICYAGDAARELAVS